ncbi:MAG TPA: matrixin family metalloprotease [Thermoanaerobaculia bacterium]|jgi:hypothetical protein
MSRKSTILLMFALLAVPAFAATRMTYDIQGNSIPIQWEPTAFPLRYEIDASLSSRADLIHRAFQAWQDVTAANVSFQRGNIVQNGGSMNDGKVVVSMADSLFANQGAFALTTYTFDTTGRFTDVDIQVDPLLFKGNFNAEMALQHEVGHLLGLDHSAVLSSVMFPHVTRGNDELTFDSDDRLAIAAAYPKSDPTLLGATLQGRVMGDRGAIFAGQVVALNDRGSPVATALTDETGAFTIAGVPAGKYRLYVEPLDGPVKTSDLRGVWRHASTVSFPTQFYGETLQVENGKLYGNLIVSASGGAARLNPELIGSAAPGSNGFSLSREVVVVKPGQTFDLAVAGDGFTSGMTELDILNPAFRRVSDYRYASDYVSATYTVDANAAGGSAVILVKSGNESATLTGALRINSPKRSRAVGR